MAVFTKLKTGANKNRNTAVANTAGGWFLQCVAICNMLGQHTPTPTYG